MSDELPPDLIANLDQMRSASSEVARMLYAHYEELCRAGFEPDAALTLTREFQQLVLGSSLLSQLLGGDDT